jgi:Domain of unknown function (DUF4145)
MAMDQIKAPCSVCVAKTYHRVLRSAKNRDGQEQVALIECRGCGNISMRKETEGFGEPRVTYFPSPASRRRPDWIWGLAWGIEGDVDKLGDLLQEIYEAVAGGQLRLAAMGVRSLLEQIMVAKVGDQGTFSKNLSAFHEKGFISLVQRDAMSAILDAGHAVTHRAFEPQKGDLNTALDIAEGIFAAIYIHGEAASRVADRVPPRPKKP